jgi:hypothetical protein
MNALRFGTRIRENFFSKQSQSSQSLTPQPPRGFSIFASGIQLSSERFYSDKSSPKKPNGAAVGRFPYETYLDGKGFQIIPPRKEDKSAYVGLVKPPKGHSELQEEAARWGFQNLYLKKDGNDSVYTVGFTDASPSSTPMDQYTDERKQRFFERYPEGQVFDVNLNESVTSHLTGKNVEFKALLFDALSRSNPHEHPLGKMVLFLKTPGGFWDLGWHSGISNLRDSKQMIGFTNAVKDFKVILKTSDNAQSIEEKKEEDQTANKPVINKPKIVE